MHTSPGLFIRLLQNLSPRLLPLCLLLCCFLQACAYGILDDKRLMDTMASDKKLEKSIKSALIQKSFSQGFALSVYSFYSNVFLVGEIPDYLHKQAIQIAEAENPRSVTTHFFTKKKSSKSDFMLSTKLRTALIDTKGLSSTRIETEVNAGRVVLLGVVGSEKERRLAIRTAEQVPDVDSVTSYLMLPPKPGRED